MAEPVQQFVINSVNTFGCADPLVYPNPVPISRQVYEDLLELAAEGPTHLLDKDIVLDWLGEFGAAACNAQELVKFFQKPANWNLYVEGATGRGFEIKRFRVAFHYQNGSILVLRESEDFKSLQAFTLHLSDNYKKKGWIIRNIPETPPRMQFGKQVPSGIGICRETKNAITGAFEEQVFSVIKVTSHLAREATPIADIRYPSADAIKHEGG